MQRRALVLGCALVAACAGAPPREDPDPYGRRIARCANLPRPISDAASEAMIPIAGGSAVLGSTAHEREEAYALQAAFYGDDRARRARWFDVEEPRHVERVRSFVIDRAPVTNEAYAEFAAACGIDVETPETLTAPRYAARARRFGLSLPYSAVARFLWPGSAPPRGRERHPAVLVSHDDAAFYCAWRGARLPTEREWERAARGARGSVYPWGDAYDPARVVGAGSESGARDTRDVGQRSSAAPDGTLDMGGHVFEWTSTEWPRRAGAWVVKGGSWDDAGGWGRGAARQPRPGALRHVVIGMRCAADS